MYLKRIRDDSGRAMQVRILRSGDAWRPSTRVIEQGTAEGWLTLGGGAVTLHTPEGDVRFRIIHPPGRRCVQTGRPLGSEKEAREHATTVGSIGADPENLSGYINARYYDCVREH